MSKYGEPWSVEEELNANRRDHEDGEDVLCYDVTIGNSNDYHVADYEFLNDAERVVACVNALAGIDDPKQFMADVKAGAKLLVRGIEELIANDVNLCPFCNRYLIYHIPKNYDRYKNCGYIKAQRLLEVMG